MSDDTLITMRAEVRRLLPGRDTREVIEAIERVHGPNRWSRKSIIVACHKLRTWGSFSEQRILPDGPDALVHLRIPRDTHAVYTLKAETRLQRLHDLLLCIIEAVADEDLIDIFCPPVPGSV